jgi:hypothetical protein
MPNRMPEESPTWVGQAPGAHDEWASMPEKNKRLIPADASPSPPSEYSASNPYLRENIDQHYDPDAVVDYARLTHFHGKGENDANLDTSLFKTENSVGSLGEAKIGRFGEVLKPVPVPRPKGLSPAPSNKDGTEYYPSMPPLAPQPVSAP